MSDEPHVATLDDLRRLKFKTIKAFAAAWGVSASTASLTLQGRRSLVMSPDEVRRIAAVLGAHVQATMNALDASAAEWRRSQGYEEPDHFAAEYRRGLGYSTVVEADGAGEVSVTSRDEK